ncbi:MAG: hypothetical protein PHC34_01135 [Candidatus Gastranaerophilales bacterium]|nr:hypothetical protein [Candidatus Gastranaerophilales bacterium]
MLSLAFTTFFIQPVSKYSKEINNIELTNQIVFYLSYFPYKFYEIVFKLCSEAVNTMPTPDEFINKGYSAKQGFEIIDQVLGINSFYNTKDIYQNFHKKLRGILKIINDLNHFSIYSKERVIIPAKSISYEYEITSFLPILNKIDKKIEKIVSLYFEIIKKDENDEDVNAESNFLIEIRSIKKDYLELIDKYTKIKLIGFIQNNSKVINKL